MKNNWVLYGGAIIVVAFIVLIVSSSRGGGVANPQMDAFASCLTEKGATYYGAFWCPNCAKQNQKFGNSKKLVNYVECSTPDGKGQLQVCKDAGIKNYPTWEFPPTPGTTTPSRLIGTQELATLAAKTGCELPNAESTNP